MTIVAPMDTGLWVMLCNQSGSGFGPPPPPCDADTNRSACEDGWGCKWENATAAGGAGSCASWGCANVTSEQQCDTMGQMGWGCDWSNATSQCTEHHHHHGFGAGRNREGVQGAHLNPLGLFLNPLASSYAPQYSVYGIF